MSDAGYVLLTGRGIIDIHGDEARSFLQGLISNDVNRVTANRAIYAALLTAQGKFLHDFFVVELDGHLLLDCEADRLADLMRRLTLYKLRAKLTITDRSREIAVAAVFGPGALEALGLGSERGLAAPLGDGVAVVDPRLPAMGARCLLPAATAAATLQTIGLVAAAPEDYHRLRLAHGVPDGSRDLQVEKTFLLEANFEELDGVDFAKGCYVGQELTARTKHRGTVRRRLFRVDVEGPLPPPGTPVMLGEKEAGTMQSGVDGTGLAMLRLEDIETARASGTPLVAGEARLTPIKPAWANF